MSRTKFARALAESLGEKGVRVSKNTAGSVYDDLGSRFERIGHTAVDQPSRMADSATKNIKLAGYGAGAGAGVGGLGLGGGLAYREMLRKDQTRVEQATEREKIALLEGVLNDPDVSDENKAELIQALTDAGLFSEEDKQNIWEQMGLPDLTGGGLDPGEIFGGGGIFGGLQGWVVFLIIVYVVVKLGGKAMEDGGGS